MVSQYTPVVWNECNHDDVGSAPTIKNHSVTHFGNYLYCFGGYDGRRNHMTLLLYDLRARRWIRPPINTSSTSVETNADPDNFEIVVQGTPPPGRNGHSATIAPEDEENGRIIIVGGWLGVGPYAASDMHVLDVSAGGARLRWYQPPVKGTPPGSCNMHSADYVAARKEVYVFRGGNGREYLNDLHALHVDALEWRCVDTTGEIPQQRANHSSAMMEETGELFIFGGWNGKERLNDIHILDTATSNWTFPKVGGILPHPRAGMTLTALRGRLFLFGGSGTSAKCFQDLQILDRQEMAWLDVSQQDESSSTRAHGSNHYDSDAPSFRFGGTTRPHDRCGRQSNEYQSHYRNDDAVDARPQQGGTQEGTSSFYREWNSADLAHSRSISHRAVAHISPNPNDQDTVPSVIVHGQGPGSRAGHTATAANRSIYVFGGSCGSEYLNDFHVLDTDPAPHAYVSEPTSLQLCEQRLRHFFNDEEFSDVTFVVQGQRVYGHKMVLSIVSDCFRAMFTNGFRESEEMEIEIPDCSHSAFLAVMEYVYTGSLPQYDFKTQENRNRNLERVIELLELADRFFLDHLKQVCETMLQNGVNSDTCDYLLAVSQKTNATQLKLICEHFLRNLSPAVD